MFNGEALTNLHLSHMEPVVDLFVVVESIFSHSGLRKEEFYLDRYSSWFNALEEQNKILKIKVSCNHIY